MYVIAPDVHHNAHSFPIESGEGLDSGRDAHLHLYDGNSFQTELNKGHCVDAGMRSMLNILSYVTIGETNIQVV